MKLNNGLKIPQIGVGTGCKVVSANCHVDAHLGPADWFGRALIDVVPEDVKIGINY